MSPSVFFEFTLPNATTWSCFSLLLAVALFFKFSRLLSMRNLDVLTLYLLVPGLLLLQEPQRRWLWIGYLLLLCGSGYFLVRCLLDLTLVRRPALSPNLTLGGLAWLGGALTVFLVPVAIRQGPAVGNAVGERPAPEKEIEKLIDNHVRKPLQQANGDHLEDARDEGSIVHTVLALLCHLAVVAALIFIGYRHFQDVHAGVAMATFYLLLPYTSIHISQVHHVWPSALLLWAVAAYRRPMVAGLLIGLAASIGYFPALVFPVWFGFYRGGRGAGRFLAAMLLTAAVGLSIHLFIWHGNLGPIHGWHSGMDSDFWRSLSRAEGFWNRPDGTTIHWAYRLPVVIVYFAFLITTTFWPNPKNLAHVVAQTAALLIGTQFWYADHGGVYVLWYLPLLLLLVFRPNLADRQPPLIQSENDLLARLGSWLRRTFVRLLHLPEPAVRVH